MKASDLFVKALENEGVEYIFGIPGKENFREILSTCLHTNGVHIIDLAVDYSLNHSILNVLLKEKTCIL